MSTLRLLPLLFGALSSCILNLHNPADPLGGDFMRAQLLMYLLRPVVAPHRVSKFAYVANTTSNTISMFAIDQSTFRAVALSTKTPVDSGGVGGVALDPLGSYLFASHTNGGTTIEVFGVNSTTGDLTRLSSFSTGVGTNPAVMAVHPSGNYLYAALSGTGTVGQMSVDRGTGSLNAIAANIASGATTNGIAVDPLGRFVYATNTGAASVSMYSVNASTGALTSIGANIGTNTTSPIGIAIDPQGRFAFVCENSGTPKLEVFSINQSTGALTSVSVIGVVGGSFFSAVNPQVPMVYVTVNGASSISMFTFDPSGPSIAAASTPSIAASTGPFTMAVDPSARFLYATNNGGASMSMYTIDSAGILTATSPPTTGTGSGPNNVVIYSVVE